VTTRQFAAAAILAIALGSPVMELFDDWDATFQDGNDTEAHAVVVALCIGVALAIGPIVVVTVIRARASSLCRDSVVARIVWSLVSPTAVPSPTTSPPVPLRL
jgi:hypothetical protein